MLTSDPLWYKDAIIYELHVRAFSDSLGDGMGDFRGLQDKLDYLHDLGVTAIWLLPFYPSPLRDDGYDIADYSSVHPDFGTMEMLRDFIAAAHDRGLRVITELVLNHTSDQHPWFQRARRAPPGSVERDFYVWSDTPERYRDARIIFRDFETSNWSYDNLAKSYYWHRFYAHQPDLNYDNPAVWEAIFPVVDFWFELGVDGLRLDAVPYLYEREGTNCENLPETHGFLRALRRHVDERFANRMLLAEANQWPEDAVAYFGNGDECQMAFHFPLMPRLFMAIHMEDRFPVVDIMQQTPALHETCQWALFLRNHDELTLEMVTDEERDYMYRAYANDLRARINLGIRRRLAPLLGNNRRRIELMNGLLFSLPGTPVIYYGDEIGMGDNIYLGDRNGVRTPMQWSSDRNAGFSRANPQKLYLPIIIDPEYHYEAVNVETQQNNPNSLLWWMKRLISQRRQHPAFSRGILELLNPANRRILAFLRRYEDEIILVVANTSRFVQYVELDLSAHLGRRPVELFGATIFPPITAQPYLLTVGPHSFYWFALEPVDEQARPAVGTGDALAELHVPANWQSLMAGLPSRQLEFALQAHLRRDPRVIAARRHVRSVRLRDAFAVPADGPRGYLALVDVEYREGGPETRLVPVSFVGQEEAGRLLIEGQSQALARIHGGMEGWLCDATALPDCNRALLELFVSRGRVVGTGGGELRADVRVAGDDLLAAALTSDGQHVRTEQGNAVIQFDDALVLKLYQRVESGPHPEVEIGNLLCEEGFANAARWIGQLVYQRHREPSSVLGLLAEFVPNLGNGWQFTLDELSVFFERVISLPSDEAARAGEPCAHPEQTAELLHCIGPYGQMVRQLGQRLAELHVVLASRPTDPVFAPEGFGPQYQRSLYQSHRSLMKQALDALRCQIGELPVPLHDAAQRVLEAEECWNTQFRRLLGARLESIRIRCHGDCHLGQVLFTGKDFIFIDFEGSPRETLAERRIKRTPIRDAVAMLRSFDYAAQSALLGLASGRGRLLGALRPEDRELLAPWTRAWRQAVQGIFWQAYCDGTASTLRWSPDERELLRETFLLEKLFFELRHELMRRPAWVEIPLSGLDDLLKILTAADAAR